jgi:hypothetical protein
MQHPSLRPVLGRTPVPLETVWLARCATSTTLQRIRFTDDDDWRGLIHSNTPGFDKIAGDTFKGVEVARVALRLYSEQTHFYIAVRAEKQRLDRLLLVGFWEPANVSHAMHPCWLLALLLLASMAVV